MPRIPIIPAMYFGPAELYRLLARHKQVIVDVGEHYERQSYRTRTRIIGPNGVQDLVVPIERRSGEKMPMRTVGLAYAESWPQQHMHAIRSAYGKTPWYIHFEEGLASLILQRHERLVDLDIASMKLGLQWLGLSIEMVVRERYVDADPAVHLDLRSSFHPKRPIPPDVPAMPGYPQVFADRHGFMPRMSIIDLLCNAGPQARMIISQ